MPAESTSLLGKAAPATTTWSEATRTLGRYSAPLVVANLLQFTLVMSSMIIISPRGKVELGAVSVATTTSNITGFMIFQGLATSLDTLCSQAWGSGNASLSRLHVQRVILLLAVVSIPIAGLWMCATQILGVLLPDSDTVALAGLYLKILVCAIPGYVTFEAGKRILTSEGTFLPVTGILCAGAATNALLGYVLVWRTDMGFIGAPIAVAATWTLIPIYFYIYLRAAGKGGIWVHRTSRALSGWGPMIRLALPGLVMIEAEYFAFEVLVILSAQLSTANLAAQTILATLNGAFWQFPFSLSIAGSTMIAQHIGARSASLAKISAVVIFMWTFVCSAINSTLFFSFRTFWPTIFSSDPDVLELVENTLPLVAAMHLFDGLATTSNGILRGMGRPSFGGWANLSCYYIIALPLSFYATFVLSWGLKGLWVGVTLALFIVTAAEVLYMFKTDWQGCVEDAEWRNSSPLDQDEP